MAAARLTILLACLGLVISRVGLVVHEVGGHGGAAVLFGGRVLEVTFFWFGGGWIRYTTPSPTELASLIIQLGGILAELLLGAAALAWTSRKARPKRAARPARPARPARSFGTLALRLAGFLFVVHGLWYAATGIWHGFGDGARLHELLGAARYPVALLLGAALCALVAVAARQLCRAFAPALPGSSPRRLVLVMGAACLAGGLHAALAFGEVRLRRDAVYGQTMRTADERLRDERLARWRAEQARRGHTVAAAEVRAQTRALTPPRPFPFARLLALAALLSMLLGAASLRRARLGPDETDETDETDELVAISPRMLAAAACAALLAISAVALLDLW
jgi:hypothetical protein